MASLNSCTFIGNLGKDPEISHTQSGVKVGKFSLAVNEKYKDKESTLWVNITTFDKLAELTSQYCHKGMAVYVEGRLSVRQYDRQDGTKGTSVEVIANKVVFLERKRDSAESSHSDPAPSGSSNPGISDDDIPF